MLIPSPSLKTQDTSKHQAFPQFRRNWYHAQRFDMNASCLPFPLPQPPQPPPQPCKWGKSRNIPCLIRTPPIPIPVSDSDILSKRAIQIFQLTHKATANFRVLPLLCIIDIPFTSIYYYYTTLLLRQSEAHHAVATIAAIATVATIVTVAAVAAEVTVAATEITIATAFISNVQSQRRLRHKWIFRSENQNVQAG